MNATYKIRPGLLVSLKTSLTGNVQYVKQDIEAEHDVDNGNETKARVASWQTERTIADAGEYEAARKARYEAGRAISVHCVATAFGLLCPEQNEAALMAAIAEARAIADAFNATATLTRVSVNVIAGRVARDDIEAAKAINSEVSALIERMQSGVALLDADMVRDAATKAKAIAEMLSDEGKTTAEFAIEAARKAARAITRAVKAGEVAALEIDEQTMRRLAVARTAFIDLDDGSPVAAPAISPAARAIDLAGV